jgi:mannose-6-phosphate isomerase-like protein (cupin superfamily)
MRFVVLTILTATVGWGAAGDVDVYSPKDLQAISQGLAQKRTQFASEQLKKYGSSHYTMVAYREATGSSELHEKEADFFVVVDGDATILTGGKLVNPKTEKAGELRGSSIEGGERHELAKGSVIHIPAGTPHQLLIEKGKPFTYFVLKVIEQ